MEDAQSKWKESKKESKLSIMTISPLMFGKGYRNRNVEIFKAKDRNWIIRNKSYSQENHWFFEMLCDLSLSHRCSWSILLCNLVEMHRECEDWSRGDQWCDLVETHWYYLVSWRSEAWSRGDMLATWARGVQEDSITQCKLVSWRSAWLGLVEFKQVTWWSMVSWRSVRPWTRGVQE